MFSEEIGFSLGYKLVNLQLTSKYDNLYIYLLDLAKLLDPSLYSIFVNFS